MRSSITHTGKHTKHLRPSQGSPFILSKAMDTEQCKYLWQHETTKAGGIRRPGVHLTSVIAGLVYAEERVSASQDAAGRGRGGSTRRDKWMGESRPV